MNTYKTIEIARIFGIHANTVRLYEKYGLISKPKRGGNGYRIFTDIHIEQLKLARAALQVEVLQNGLRKQAVTIIQTSASGDYEKAAKLTQNYIAQVETEKENAKEAIEVAENILSGIGQPDHTDEISFSRKETAELLNVTVDTLRNWELNGLFTIKRLENGYRVYTEKDLQRLKIIRSLRCAYYSLSSILRMLQALSEDPAVNIRVAIDTPGEEDDIITACDKLLTSLNEAGNNARFVARQIEKLKKMTRENPTLTHQPEIKC